jgi:hypothetical protein
MNKHTPGPWKAVYVGCGDWDLNGPVTQEDWTLAAAAPELLEALQYLLVAHGEQLDHAFQMAQDAIAKATKGN